MRSEVELGVKGACPLPLKVVGGGNRLHNFQRGLILVDKYQEVGYNNHTKRPRKGGLLCR